MTYSGSYYKPGKDVGFELGKDGSAILQIASVVVNTISVFLIALSLLDHLDSTYLYLGIFFFVAGLAGVLYTRAFTLLIYVARVLVGGLFIVSGMIKANDAEGFSYKLHDYFQENALNMEGLNDYAIYMAILIGVGEIVLGVATIIGGRMRLTSWTLLILIVFFSWLTHFTASCLDDRDDFHEVAGAITSADGAFQSGKYEDAFIKYDYANTLLDDLGGTYQDSLRPALKPRLALATKLNARYAEIQSSTQDSAQRAQALESLSSSNSEEIVGIIQGNPVPDWWKQCVDDCGCFGDAMKGSVGRSLYPWESFGKDAVLLYFVILIFIQQKRIRLNNDREDMWLIGSSLLIIGFLCWVFDGWYFSLIFTILVMGLYIFMKRMNFGRMNAEWPIAAMVTIAAFTVAIFTYTFLPMKDYRPYAVGNNILKKMDDAVVDEDPEIIYTYIHRETKKKKQFTKQEYLSNWEEIEKNYIHLSTDAGEDSGRPASIQDLAPYKAYGQFTERERNDADLKALLFNPVDNPVYKVFYMEEWDAYDSVEVEAYDPEYYPDSVYKFIEDYQKPPSAEKTVDFTQYLLSRKEVIWVVSKKLEEALEGSLEGMKKLVEDAEKAGVPVYVLTASGDESRAKFDKRLKYSFNYLTVDHTELKIVVRSNPGVVLLKDAVVMDKWSSRRIPSFEDMKTDYLKD